MAATAASLATVQKAYIAYYGRPADPIGLDYWATQLDAANGNLATIINAFGTSAEATALQAGKSTTVLVNDLYQQLFGRDAEVAGLTYYVNRITSGQSTLSTVMLDILYGATGSDATTVANKLAAADLYTAALDTTAEIIAYGGTTAATSARTFLAGVTTAVPAADAVATSVAGMVTGASVVAGQTYTLTTGSNSLTGTAGNDNFDAGLSSGALQTLNSGDSLDGGAGTDSLQAVINGSVTPATLKNIESIYLTNITTGSTVDLTNATGLTSVVNQASTVALTISGVSKAVALTVQDTTTAGQVITYNDVTGSADAATVALKNVGTGASLTIAGVETLTLNSTGSTAANVVSTGLTTANTTTLIVTGDKALTLGTLSTSVQALDVSANTGTGVSATFANTTATTVTGGAGNDSFTFGSSALADSVDAGAGNDTIIFTANFTTTDTVNGGEGTDTLRGVSAELVTASASTPTTYRVTNIETIQATDALANAASVTPGNISATVNRFNLALTGADIAGATGTIVGTAGAFTVGLGGSAAGNTAGQLATASTLTINDTGAAITDSLTIINSARNSTTGLSIDVFDSSNLAIGGYETVTINTGSAGGATNALGTITVTGDVGGTTAETVNFTGGNLVTAGIITADIVDASGLTAASGTLLTMVTGSTATKVTGSAGIDILFGNTTLASTIDGGAGNDTITGGSGKDSITGGDGNDTITTGGGADTVNAGAGNDTVVATLASGNVITGGDGTDVLSLAAAATAATATGVSGFETLTLTAAFTQDMVLFLDNPTFTKIQGGVAGTSAFTNVGAGITTLATTIAANTSSVARLIDTSSNSLTVTLLGNATTTLITADNEETINLNTSSAVGATTLSTLTATDLHTLNITGSNAIVVTTLSANTTTAGTTLTIDGSANTGGIAVSATNSTIVANITGSATASNVLVGSAGADTIVGSSAADTITGGNGVDIMTGGAGADTFIFAAGSSGGAPSSTVFDTITDFASASDIIDHASAITIEASVAAASSGVASISAAGIATFFISDSTLALRLTAVAAAIELVTATTAGEAAAFNFGSDAYVFISDGVAGVGANDVLIKLTGISTTNSAFDTITLAGGNMTLA